jgi:hypothetical protein
LKDPIKYEPVVKELTKDGSNINDWNKMTTQVGDYQTHYYQNAKTGEINYNYDYKTIINDNIKK